MYAAQQLKVNYLTVFLCLDHKFSSKWIDVPFYARFMLTHSTLC